MLTPLIFFFFGGATESDAPVVIETPTRGGMADYERRLQRKRDLEARRKELVKQPRQKQLKAAIEEAAEVVAETDVSQDVVRTPVPATYAKAIARAYKTEREELIRELWEIDVEMRRLDLLEEVAISIMLVV